MEARRLRGSALPVPVRFVVMLMLAAGAMCGCQGMFVHPGASRSDPPPRPDDEPMVVRAESQPSSAPAADLDVALAEKIENWAMKVQRADAQRARGESAPLYAADPSTINPTDRAAAGGAAAAGPRPARTTPDPREIRVEFTPEKPKPAGATAPPAPEVTAEPPVLRNVWPAASITRSAPRGAGRPESESVGLNETATASVSTPASLADMLDEILNSSADGGFREQMDRRIAAVLLGDYGRARQPFELVPDEQNQLGQRLIETLIAVRDQSGGDPAGESTDALRSISELRHSLRSVSDVGLPTVAICRSVRGFGQYEAFEPSQFIAGRANEFVLYCELRDFASAAQPDGTFESRFALHVAILSHSGDEVASLAAEDIVDRCRTRRNDCFLSPVIRLPGTLSPGEYSARVTVEDKIKKRVVERIATFRLVSKG